MNFEPAKWELYTGVARDFATIFSVIVAAFALFRSAKTASETFTNRKREFAATLAYNFAKDENWFTSQAIELARSKKEFVDNIINKRATSIPAEFYESVFTLLKSRQDEKELPSPPTGDPNVFHITSTQSELIRFFWVNWLNQLEGVLASWEHETGDRTIMEGVWAPSIFRNDEIFKAIWPLVDQSEIIKNFREKMKKQYPGLQKKIDEQLKTSAATIAQSQSQNEDPPST